MHGQAATPGCRTAALCALSIPAPGIGAKPPPPPSPPIAAARRMHTRADQAITAQALAAGGHSLLRCPHATPGLDRMSPAAARGGSSRARGSLDAARGCRKQGVGLGKRTLCREQARAALQVQVAVVGASGRRVGCASHAQRMPARVAGL